jgi:hypothetical protein
VTHCDVITEDIDYAIFAVKEVLNHAG